ncbi:MAG: hypothetical protein HKP19_13395, partial [Xanthomonadales bacterium]|nr:hypothetical protein [Xanthomonadales bacterium]
EAQPLAALDRGREVLLISAREAPAEPMEENDTQGGGTDNTEFPDEKLNRAEASEEPSTPTPAEPGPAEAPE